MKLRTLRESSGPRQVWMAVAVVAIAVAAGCERPPAVYHITGPTMGTTFSVKVLPKANEEEGASEHIARVVKQQLDLVNALMSTYQDDSELSRFNQWASTEPFELSEETFHVLQLAHTISEATNGAFDVTVGPLVNAWGFGPAGYAVEPPSPEALEALHQRVGFTKIELDEGNQAARKLQPDVYADLSAIAKGFGVDCVYEALRDLGYENLMVEVGGEVRAAGHNDRGTPWQIAIEKPVTEERAIERIIPLDGVALATSGDYRNYMEQDGARLSHIIDPRTNRPIAHKLASASVIHKECAVADGYATAMMVLGAEEGYEVAVREGLAVLFIIRADDGTFTERATPAFEQQFGAASPRTP